MRLLAAAWLPALLGALGAEPSCPADGGPGACPPLEAEEGLPGSAGLPPSVLAAHAAPNRSLVDQEISHLHELVRHCKERLAVLRELQSTLAADVPLQDLPEAHRRALQDAVPPVWEVAGDETTSQSAAPGDFLVSKATVPQEEPVALIRWLPLRSQRSAGPSANSQLAMPTSLLVAVQADSTTRLFTPHGELALSFSAGHEEPIAQLAVSPLHDEYIVATGDVTGLVRMHRINVRQRRIPREERQARLKPGGERVSQHLGVQANVTVQFAGELVAPGPRAGAAFTALVMVSQQGTKYFVTGDSHGGISVLTRNGTLHSELKAPHGVDSLNSHIGNIVFVAGGEWGFVDLERFQARVMRCSKFEGRITAAIIDTQQSARILAADDKGAVWAFMVRDKRTCKIEHRFSTEVTRPPIELASIRGFVVVLDHSTAWRGRVSTLALNMSHVGKKRHDPERAFPAMVWRRWTPPVKQWVVQKRYQQGDLMATLSADGLEVEITEVLMHVYQPNQGDTLGNFKLPVFAVAIVLVLGYQYVKQQGAFDPGLMES